MEKRILDFMFHLSSLSRNGPKVSGVDSAELMQTCDEEV